MSNLKLWISTAAMNGLGSHRNLAAAAFVLVMVAGFSQMVQALASLDWREIALAEDDFRKGKTTATLERQLDQKMPQRNNLIGLANGVRYVLTGGSVDQVRGGRNGWLFLTEEIRYDTDGPAHMSARMDLLASTRLALQSQGVDLLVAIVPDKARIYADQLYGAGYPSFSQTRYSDAIVQLTRRGIPSVDLMQPMLNARPAQDVYYRTDTHWNQTGAALAASAVADAIRRLNPELGSAQFLTQQDAQATQRFGDLIRLMGLDAMPAFIRPEADQEVTSRTTLVKSTAGGGLLGDVYLPVVLVGTSYSLRGNFHGYLQQHLGASVLNAAMDGGGFLQAMGDYLKNDAFLQSKPKVLVWELPERFLYMPLHEEAGWLKKAGLSQ
jgi:alginate O-acetyltransferase complex protein AlgJ